MGGRAGNSTGVENRAVKKLLIIVGLLVLLLLAGAWTTGYLGSSTPAAEFTLAPVEYGAMSESVSATGVLQPQASVIVSSPVGGQVIEILPDAEVNKQVR